MPCLSRSQSCKQLQPRAAESRNPKSFKAYNFNCKLARKKKCRRRWLAVGGIVEEIHGGIVKKKKQERKKKPLAYVIDGKVLAAPPHVGNQNQTQIRQPPATSHQPPKPG